MDELIVRGDSGVMKSEGGGEVMYRGISSDAKNPAGVTWVTPDKSLAKEYSGFRGGEGGVVSMDLNVKNPFEAYHAEQQKKVSDFIEDVIIQMDNSEKGFVDEGLAESQIKKIESKFKGSNQVNKYWLDKDVIDFMKNAGFDSIKSPEGGANGIMTYGIFE